MTNHPSHSTLYTVLSPSGEVEERGCTTTEAAAVILNYDGGAYEVRRGDEKHDVAGEAQWHLWTRSGANGAKWAVTVIKPVYALSAEAAWPMIAREVLLACGNWRRSCSVMTDADYDAALNSAA